MVSYLSSVENCTSDIPYIAFKLYNHIVVPYWVDLDPCLKRGVVEVVFRLSNKASGILTSFLSSYYWNTPIRNNPYQPLYHYAHPNPLESLLI